MKKILILSANPDNTSQLRLATEIREIDEGLRRSRYRHRFKICQKWAVRPRDLRRALIDESPQYVHFCGHGDKEGIMLEGDNGEINLLSGELLSDLFGQFSNTVECVLLNACYSKNQAEAINKKIGYVIGMNNVIGDEEAIEFAVGFYDGLGAGESVEKAFNLGCIAIRSTTVLPAHMMPVLRINHDIVEQNEIKENDTYLVQIILEGNFADFDETTKENLMGAVAGMLNIEKQYVKIKYVFPGSIRVILELPKASEKELISLLEMDDKKVKELAKQFRLLEIKPLGVIEPFLAWFDPDPKSAQKKYEALYQTLYFWLARKGFGRDEIEDFTSQVILAAQEQLVKNSTIAEIKAEKYIFGIARNKRKEYHRRISKRPKIESLDTVKPTSEETPAAFESAVEIEEEILDAIHVEQVKKYLKKCWRKLEKIDRVILSRFRKIGYGYARQLTKELGMTENGIFSRKSRALEQLRKCIEKYLDSS